MSKSCFTRCFQSPIHLIQKLCIDVAVDWIHGPIADAETLEVDRVGGGRVLVVDLPGDGGNILAGVGFPKDEEVVGSELREDGEELGQHLVEVGRNLILVSHQAGGVRVAEP